MAIRDLQLEADWGSKIPPVDGDILFQKTIGSWMVYDGTVWRAIRERDISVIDITKPPYNASIGAADNSAAIQAALDQVKVDIAAGRRPAILFPGSGIFRVTSQISFDPGQSSTLLYMFTPGQGGILFDFSSTGSGFYIGNSAIINNRIVMDGLQFLGNPAVGPDILVDFDRCTQVYCHRVNIGDPKKYGMQGSLLGHFSWYFGQLTENTINDADGAGLHLNNTSDDVRVVGIACEGVSGSNLALVRFNNGRHRQFHASSNVNTGTMRDMFKLREDGTGYLERGVFIGNHGVGLLGHGIDLWRTGGANVHTDIVIANNVFNGSTGQEAVRTRNLKNAVISSNVCNTFGTGISLSGSSERVQIKDNQLLGCTFQGIFLDTAYNDMEIEGNMVTSALYLLRANATTGGHNRIRDLIAGDDASRALAVKYFFNGAGAFDDDTDIVELANRPQKATVPDSGDGNPGTLSVQPYYGRISLTNNDPDGATVTLANSNIIGGTVVTVLLVSSVGGTVTVEGTAISTVGSWIYDGSAWTPLYTN